MDGPQVGHPRTEQDVIVNSARDTAITGITSWRQDVPGGRVLSIQISEPVLYLFAFDLMVPIMTMRLHRVKRVTDATLQNEVRDHSAAIATHFVRCCYQQMRESASVRFSPIVQDLMFRDLRITRSHLPSVLARIAAGFGPITISEGHMKHTHLVPYMDPGDGDMHHDDADIDHPWITTVSTFLTAMTALRPPPEIRTGEVDFTGTQGSAFWTIWSSSPEDNTLSTGFCPLPESYNSDVDRLLAAIIRKPLYSWPTVPIVAIDWSSHEFELPHQWGLMDDGDIRFGIDVITAQLNYVGDRQFYFPRELLCAQVVSRLDHRITMVRPRPQPQQQQPAATQAPADDQEAMSQGSQVSTRSQTRRRGSSRIITGRQTQATTSGIVLPPPERVPVLTAYDTQRVRVGYAGFYGSAFEGISADVSRELAYKAFSLI